MLVNPFKRWVQGSVGGTVENKQDIELKPLVSKYDNSNPNASGSGSENIVATASRVSQSIPEDVSLFHANSNPNASGLGGENIVETASRVSQRVVSVGAGGNIKETAAVQSLDQHRTFFPPYYSTTANYKPVILAKNQALLCQLEKYCRDNTQGGMRWCNENLTITFIDAVSKVAAFYPLESLKDLYNFAHDEMGLRSFAYQSRLDEFKKQIEQLPDNLSGVSLKNDLYAWIKGLSFSPKINTELAIKLADIEKAIKSDSGFTPQQKNELNQLCDMVKDAIIRKLSDKQDDINCKSYFIFNSEKVDLDDIKDAAKTVSEGLKEVKILKQYEISTQLFDLDKFEWHLSQLTQTLKNIIDERSQPLLMDLEKILFNEVSNKTRLLNEIMDFIIPIRQELKVREPDNDLQYSESKLTKYQSVDKKELLDCIRYVNSYLKLSSKELSSDVFYSLVYNLCSENITSEGVQDIIYQRLKLEELNKQYELKMDELFCTSRPSQEDFSTVLLDGNIKRIEHCLKYYSLNDLISIPKQSMKVKPYYFLLGIREAGRVHVKAVEMAKLMFEHNKTAKLDNEFLGHLRFTVEFGIIRLRCDVKEYLPLISVIARYCPEISIDNFKRLSQGSSSILDSAAWSTIEATINEARKGVSAVSLKSV